MALIEPLAAYVPYMTCPGNHEHPNNYKEYRHRFPMPISKKSHQLYYSFDTGPIHFVSLNVEVYYKNGGNMANLTSQYYWLKEDLSKLDREKTPWVIIFGHRPMHSC